MRRSQECSSKKAREQTSERMNGKVRIKMGCERKEDEGGWKAMSRAKSANKNDWGGKGVREQALHSIWGL